MTHPFAPELPFVQAAHWTYVSPLRPRFVSILECHSMEAPDKPGTAMGVAKWFANPRIAPQASAHVCIDQSSTVCCVEPEHVAWACGMENWDSYSLELAGRAAWLAADWLSEANTPMLGLAAVHIAKASRYFGMPLQALTDDDVAALARDGLIRRGKLAGALSGHPGGVSTHMQTNRVWKNWDLHGLPKPTGDLSHSDPGVTFPLDALLDMAQRVPLP